MVEIKTMYLFEIRFGSNITTFLVVNWVSRLTERVTESNFQFGVTAQPHAWWHY